MDENHIIGSEFILLIVLGALLPWTIAIVIQTRLYLMRGLTKWQAISSAAIMLVLTSVLGVVLWFTVPVLTISWQHIVLRVPNAFVNALAFIPLGPMTVSALVAAIPVTWLFLRRQ